MKLSKHDSAIAAYDLTIPDDTDQLIREQIAYYRARAPEYLDGTLEGITVEALEAAEADLLRRLQQAAPFGDTLELACGPGTFTEQLLRHASSVTAVDASPEMLELAARRLGANRVRFIRGDLFEWMPEHRYDFVFFSFWLSHVPLARFAEFFSMVAAALRPSGRVFFIDDGFRTAEELVEGPRSSTILRHLSDGTAFRAVKVPHEPAELQQRLRRLGWAVEVRQVEGSPFYWGTGTRPPGR